MIAPCVTGKVIYETEEAAEEALVEAWIRNNYREGSGPKAIYQCNDCGRYHFTSQGVINSYLEEQLENGYIAKQKMARAWEEKLR